MNKKCLALAAAAMAAVTLVAGCGSSADKKDGASGEQKTLVVGMEPTFPPFEFTENDKYIGFDIDLANAIGEKMGSKVEVKSLAIVNDELYAFMTRTDDRNYSEEEALKMLKEHGDSFLPGWFVLDEGFYGLLLPTMMNIAEALD